MLARWFGRAPRPAVIDAIERCAVQAVRHETAARVEVGRRMVEMFRAGAFGSSIPDEVRIGLLEQENAMLRAALAATADELKAANERNKP